MLNTNGNMQNEVLAALPPDEYQRLEPHLKPVTIVPGQVLHELRQPLNEVYFPAQGLVSLSVTANNGIEVGIGVIGREGMVGASAICDRTATVNRAVVQIGGQAWMMPTEVCCDEFKRGGALQDILLGNLQLLHTQTAQSALCARMHTPQEQLSRWLLTVQDVVGNDEFDVPESFLKQMIDATDAQLPHIIRSLQKAGLIRYQRGHITVARRDELVQSSCPCYQTFDRLRTQFVKSRQHFAATMDKVHSDRLGREQHAQQRAQLHAPQSSSSTEPDEPGHGSDSA